jgi:hypothetical protein
MTGRRKLLRSASLSGDEMSLFSAIKLSGLTFASAKRNLTIAASHNLAQTAGVGIQNTHATALLADQEAAKEVDLNHVVLPPFAVVIGAVP